MKKVNFTSEHLSRFKELAIMFLFAGTLFEGMVGTKMNIYQIIHDSSVSTLQNMLASLKKAIAKIEELDRWSMTDYQQKKLENLKEQYDFLDLSIGFKLYQIFLEEQKAKKKELQLQIKQMEEDAMSPADKLAALKAQLAEFDAPEVSTSQGTTETGLPAATAPTT